VTYQLGLEMYSRTRLRICLSISLGWPTTGIYVQPRSASCQFTKQPNLTKKTYFGKSGKIVQGEVEHCRAVYPHVDRQPGHAIVLVRDTERVLFDLAPDLGEVEEAFCEVEELAPLVGTRGVDQLEDKRAARHDTLAAPPAREEVAPDDASKCLNK
jgi:hypothetical protein